MTNKQKYIKKTFMHLVTFAVTSASAISLFLYTMPVNFQLWYLNWDRIEINRQASWYGWKDWMTTSWEENLAEVTKIAEGSAYGNLMVEAIPIVEIVIIMLELAILFLLIVLSVNYGKSFIRRAKSIVRYYIRNHSKTAA